MSTGPGKIQQKIRRLLEKQGAGFLTTARIAVELGISQQQAYRAVRALANRNLVELTLEPNLRVWNPGATKRRREYWRSIQARCSEDLLRRPAHCGPDCRENHAGSDKQHWA